VSEGGYAGIWVELAGALPWTMTTMYLVQVENALE
jgi:hypothetical protein